MKALADNWAQRLDIRDRFLQEQRILRRADLDHVVRVYDVGEVDGTPYFVMTYADLGTVADLLAREHRLPFDRNSSTSSARQGAGSAVLHHHGSIHRDIKPANLLLRKDGDGVRVMVADLGVANLHGQRADPRRGDTGVHGSRAGPSASASTSAGRLRPAAVTYQLLTGRLAHTGTISDLATLQPPPPPTELAELPRRSTIVLMGLVVDPDRRWPTVRAYVNALQTPAPSADRTWLVSPPRARATPGRVDGRAGSAVRSPAAPPGVRRGVPGLLRRGAGAVPAAALTPGRFPAWAVGALSCEVSHTTPRGPPVRHPPAWRDRKRHQHVRGPFRHRLLLQLPRDRPRRRRHLRARRRARAGRLLPTTTRHRAEGHRRDPLDRPRTRSRRHPLLPLSDDRGSDPRRPQPLARDVLQGGAGRPRPRRRQGRHHRRPR